MSDSSLITAVATGTPIKKKKVGPLLAKDEEEVASRYQKLLKVGIPSLAMRHKMKREGVSDKIVEFVLGKEINNDGGKRADANDLPLSQQPSAKSDDCDEVLMEANCSTHFEEWGMSVYPRNPTFAWEVVLKDKLPSLQRLDITASDAVHTGKRPCPKGHSRWVCISDTHGLQGRLTWPIPDGDVLIHAGDFTRMGGVKDMREFCAWMESLPHKHKIVIAGNHEVALQESLCKKDVSEAARRLISSCDAFTYLEDSFIEILGHKVYGSPWQWQPEFCDWAFNLPRGPNCARMWQNIPTDTDILVTHGPPVGHGDKCSDGLRAGCVDLLAEILKRVKPSHHIFGHIHEGYGCTKMGDTLFLNASTCTLRYQPSNPPLVFDMPPR